MSHRFEKGYCVACRARKNGRRAQGPCVDEMPDRQLAEHLFGKALVREIHRRFDMRDLGMPGAHPPDLPPGGWTRVPRDQEAKVAREARRR